jgi:hypothetical protein
MENDVEPITGKNLSEAWAQAFLLSYKSSDAALSPGIVSFPVKENEPGWKLESPGIRAALENQLNRSDILSANQSNIETVAGTIFPESIWNRCGGDREKLFEKYDNMWPQIKKCKANRRGTYFRRLTSFSDKEINQLKEILKAWDNNIYRRSALQAGIFDPCRDHRLEPFLGFPCLQQVVFHPIGPKGRGGMKVVALYANQLLIEKAYGNYLGLCRLGKFMAGEMGLTLKRVTCIATHLKRSDNQKNLRKTDLTELVLRLREELPDAN